VFRDEYGHPTVGIIQIAEDPHLVGAGGHARRLPALPHEVDTQPTLGHDAPVVVHNAHFIGAGFNTVFAPYASLGMDVHDALRRRVYCSGGANPLTRRIFTVIALHRDELVVERRERAALPLQYPVELLVCLKTILVLAGNLTRVTADALGCVYGDSIMWHGQLLTNCPVYMEKALTEAYPVFRAGFSDSKFMSFPPEQ
jgi:hypothetical protein